MRHAEATGRKDFTKSTRRMVVNVLTRGPEREPEQSWRGCDGCGYVGDHGWVPVRLSMTKTFILHPVDPRSPETAWGRSSYKGPCLVAEDNEDTARRRIAEFFAIAGSDTSKSPWLDKDLTHCKEAKSFEHIMLSEGEVRCLEDDV